MKVTNLEFMNDNIKQEIEIKTIITIDRCELLNKKTLNSNERRQLIAERISERIMEELIKRGDI